jgi:hypothetical protein
MYFFADELKEKYVCRGSNDTVRGRVGNGEYLWIGTATWTDRLIAKRR